MNFFRTSIFDPSLVIGQILCMQSIFYTSETAFMFAWSYTDYRPSLDHIFSLQIVRPMTVIQLLSVVVCACTMPLVIERARQCLDFAFTLHFVHAIICCLYNATLPLQLTWWLLQFVSVFVCTVIGEYLCMKREMLEIPLTISPPKVIET